MCATVALNILFQDEIWLGWGGEFGLVGNFGLEVWVEFVSGGLADVVIRFGVSSTSLDCWWGKTG